MGSEFLKPGVLRAMPGATQTERAGVMVSIHVSLTLNPQPAHCPQEHLASMDAIAIEPRRLCVRLVWPSDSNLPDLAGHWRGTQ